MRAHAQRNAQMRHAHTNALTHTRTHEHTFHTAANMGNRQFSPDIHVAAMIALLPREDVPFHSHRLPPSH